MAQKVINVCDPCEAAGEDTSAVTTVEVQPPGRKKRLVLDLCEQHARDYERLDSELESYRQLAHQEGKPAPKPEPGDETPPPPPADEVPLAPTGRGERTGEAARLARNRRIREWAQTHGFPELPMRGRFPDEVIAAYEEAHPEDRAALAG